MSEHQVDPSTNEGSNDWMNEAPRRGYINDHNQRLGDQNFWLVDGDGKGAKL